MTEKSNKYFLSICVILFTMTLYSSFFTVNIGEQVILTQFGNVLKLPLNKPGLHLKIPFIQRVHCLPNHRIFELCTGIISSQLVSHGKTLFEARVHYKIGDPIKYFINFGVSLNNKEPIIQALKSALSTASKDSSILETDDFSDSQNEAVRLNNCAEDRNLKRFNALINSKGIEIVQLEITIQL